MGTILARLAALAVAAALAIPAQAYEGQSLTEDDVRHFLYEVYLAGQRCDVEWLRGAYLPVASLTFDIVGGKSFALNPDEYLEGLQRDCRFVRQDFESSRISVEVSKYRATVTGRWERGGVTRLFLIRDLDYEWVEETQTLVQTDEGVKIQDIHQTIKLSEQPVEYGLTAGPSKR